MAIILDVTQSFNL